jgi:hypothetical protein
MHSSLKYKMLELTFKIPLCGLLHVSVRVAFYILITSAFVGEINFNVIKNARYNNKKKSNFLVIVYDGQSTNNPHTRNSRKEKFSLL